MLDSFATTNSEHSDTGAKEVSVLVNQKATEPEGTTPDNTTPDNTTPDNATSQNQNTSKENISQNETKESETEYQNIAEKNTNTQSQAKTMPYTGTSTLIGIAAFAVGTIAIVSYISYRRYKNI